jgi:hypothetical protein
MRNVYLRFFAALPAVALLLTTGTVHADVALFTDIPGASSTAAAPFALDIFNGAGVATRVNVTNIVGGGGPGSDNANSKAAKIRAAINAQAPAFGAGGIMNDVHINSTNRVRVVSDPTKEALMAGAAGGVQFTANFGNNGGAPTGFNPLGSQSIVQFGIEDVFVAEVMPTSAMTTNEVFGSLASMLTMHGIAANYVTVTDLLTLSNPVPAGDFVVITNTDTGFDINAEISAVPEPASIALTTIGLLSVALWQRARRRAGRGRTPKATACNTALSV